MSKKCLKIRKEEYISGHQTYGIYRDDNEFIGYWFKGKARFLNYKNVTESEKFEVMSYFVDKILLGDENYEL